MKTLVWVEHDGGVLKDATLSAVTAASKLGEVHLLVAGKDVGGVAGEGLLHAQGGPHRPLGIAPPGFVVPDRMDAPRAHFPCQFAQYFPRPPPAKDQPRAALAQAGVKTGQAVVQPPTARPAYRAVAGCLVIQHIDGDHRSLMARRDQRRLIREAQVAAEPQQ